MNRCPDNSEWVLWAADEVTPDRRRELDAHRTTCEACRRESASLARGLKALAHVVPVAAPSVDAMRMLRQRLAAEKTKKDARPRILTFFHQYRWAAAAAAVLVVAFVAFTALPHQPVVVTPVAKVVKVNDVKDWRTDADVQMDLAKITAGIELLETTESLASIEPAPTHAAPAKMTTPEEPAVDDPDWWLIDDVDT
jgi:anti-sigma factor RsiW